MKSTQLKRPGVTLFGLLALLSIFGILLALFFPAVFKVRQAADKLKCANNMKQMGIALHNYHANNNLFPGTGGTAGKKVKGEEVEKGSWCCEILPYLEQDALYRQISEGKEGNHAVAFLHCLTRRPPQLYNKLPKIDYAGNAGTSDDPIKPAKDDGLFNKEGVKITQVTDGSSNTIMIGEKYLRITEYQTGKGAGDKSSCWLGNTIDSLRSTDGEKRTPKRDVLNEDNEKAFGSAHDKACNFLFGDGSVRDLQYTIKGDLFKAICSRDGGEEVPAELR